MAINGTNGSNGTKPLPDFDNPGKQVMKPRALAHFVLKAHDMPKMRDYWKTFMGGRIQWENEDLCFMTYDEEHHRIALLNAHKPGAKAPAGNTLMHVCFDFASLADLLLSYRQRLQHGIKPAWCVNHGPTVSIYYRDPEDNFIETQHDVFDTSEAANAFMSGPEFDENPIGTEFDPEDLIAKLRAGHSEAELSKRPSIGKRGVDSIPAVMLH